MQLLFFMSLVLSLQCCHVYSDFMKSELLATTLSNYQNISNIHMWKSNNVSVLHPFVLFHQRKAGGTSFRATIKLATQALNLSSFIPSLDGVLSETFVLPETVNSLKYSVYAGHFYWNSTEKIRNKFSCLTNFREPISRVISCVYFRFGTEFKRLDVSCINDFTIDGFTKLLVLKADPYNNSCLNEPFRILSGISDDKTVNSLGYHFNNVTHKVVPRLNDFDIAVMRDTLEHLKQCVPIVLELPESRQLLNQSFPSLYQHNAFTEDIKLLVNSRVKNGCKAPDAAHLQVIRDLTAYENVLYQSVLNKVHSALREFNISVVANSSNSNTRKSKVLNKDHNAEMVSLKLFFKQQRTRLRTEKPKVKN